MIQTSAVLLILSCQKYEHKMATQKHGWLKDILNIPYFHVIGNEELTTDYIIDTSNHILYVKTPDDYISLPKKVIAAYSAISKEYVFEYIFKTDDDQKLIEPSFLYKILSILKTKNPRIHYAGNIVNVETPYISEYNKIHPELPDNLEILPTKYCSGRFYVLSDLATQQLLSVSTRKKIESEMLEDYAIGLHLNPILKAHMLPIQTNKYFIDYRDDEYVFI
jgi:hypothetical protein